MQNAKNEDSIVARHIKDQIVLELSQTPDPHINQPRVTEFVPRSQVRLLRELAKCGLGFVEKLQCGVNTGSG
jgi:hypothetical protein